MSNITGVFYVTTSTTVTLQNLTNMTSINWGDGTINNELTHDYSEGTYNFSIEGVTGLGINAFKDCTVLKEIILNNITSIFTSAFQGCTLLDKIELPTTLRSIGSMCFYGDNLLTTITIPNNVQTIDNYAFNDCSLLESIVIGAGVTSIGGNAFTNCSNLVNIYLLRTASSTSDVPTITNNTFSTISSNAKFYVYQSSLEYYKTKENWTTYDTKIVNGSLELDFIQNSIANKVWVNGAVDNKLLNKQDIIQCVKLPTPIASLLGNVYQYIGTDDGTLTPVRRKGAFYQVVQDGSSYVYRFIGLENTATGSYSLTLEGNPSTTNLSTNIGVNSSSYGYGSTAVGCDAQVGTNVSPVKGAIQLGKGSNTEDGSLYVGLSTDGSTWNNYKMLDSAGEIPTDRLTNIILTSSSDPTTSTVGTVGLLLTNTTNGKLWKCIGAGSTYTWVEMIEDKPFELVNTITVQPATRFIYSYQTSSGVSYNYKEMIVKCYCPQSSGSTANVGGYFCYNSTALNNETIIPTDRIMSTSQDVYSTCILKVRGGIIEGYAVRGGSQVSTNQLYTNNYFSPANNITSIIIATSISSESLPANTIIKIYAR